MKKFYVFFEKLTTKKLSVLFLFFSFFISTAQVTTNSGSGLAPTYSNLASAITALNSATITNPVVITLTGNEIAPAGGYSITAQGTTANTIIIEGVTSIITANAALTAGALNDAIFKLVGADYVTIRNFTMQENVANTTTAAATNNMTEWGVALLYTTSTNGSQNNTIQSNTIDLNRTYQNTFGIYSNSTHTATAMTTTATATTAAGGNSGLKIYGNTISDVNNGIVVVGPNATADLNDGLDIGGTSLSTGNTITNYGTTGTFSGYANVSQNANGILVRNIKNYNISFNTITSSNGAIIAGNARGIFVQSFVTTPTGTFVNNNTIKNNNLSVKSGFNTGGITGIDVGLNTANPTAIIDISNNDFNNFGHTVAGSGNISFLSNSASCLTTTINFNTFTNITVNTTGSVNFILNNVARPANAVCNVNNNSIVTGFNKTGAGGTVQFYISSSITPATGTETNTGNNFSNVTVTGTTQIAGWQNTDGSATSPFGPTKTISNNTFSNITGVGSQITLLNVGYGNAGATNVVANNIISNITNGVSITGITSPAGSQIFESNTINNLTSTGAFTVSGLVISGGTSGGALAGTQKVFKNKIYDLEDDNTAGSVNGILVSGGVNVELQNNIIGDLKTPSSNAANPLNGINITSTTASSTVNVYNNTVLLEGVSGGSVFGSSAISVSTIPIVTLRNNIFVNNSAQSNGGYSVAYRRSSTTLTTYSVDSNNNLFYGNNIFTDGTNVDVTLSDFKARVATRDAVSIDEFPAFLSVTGSDANFLHISTVIPTAIESGGINVTGLTTDFDNNIRQGNVGYVGTGATPDIGADEFEGVSSTPVCSGAPAAAFTVSTNNNFCVGNSTNLSLDVTYTDLNITYQWQSSADNISYSPIGGATLSTLNGVSPITTTWYRCVVTCTVSALSTTSTPVQVIINSATYATVPFSESFEATWLTTCVTAPLGEDTPSNNWRMFKGTDADASWRADNTTTTLSGWAGVLGIYDPVSQDGSRSARFHSRNVGTPAGDKGSLNLYVDLSTPGTKELSFYYITPSAGTDQLEVLLSTDGGLTFNPLATTPAMAAPTTAVGTWANVKAILPTLSTTSVIRFLATGDNGSFDIGLDNVRISVLCSGAQAITTSSNVAICNGASTVLTATSTNDPNHNYSWSPATGLSATTGGSVTAGPTETTTYTVIATDNITGCTTSGSIIVTVNPAPTEVIVTPATPVICSGTIQQLNATGAYVVKSVLSGVGTNTSSGNSTGAALGPNPLQNAYGGAKQQWIYTATELTALGFSAGTQINTIKLDLATVGTSHILLDLVVKMKNSATTSFPSTSSWETGLTTVRSAASYTPVYGLNSFIFDTPFTWNGTSNLVIEINYSNNNSFNPPVNNTAKHSPTSFVSTIFYRANNLSASVIDNYSLAATATISSRNDVTFVYTNVAPVTWSPTTDLYTDAAATIAYTGTPATIVYTKPSANVTYTATATVGTCTESNTSVITVTNATTPTGASTQTLNGGVASDVTIEDILVSGTGIIWYPTVTDAANGTNSIPAGMQLVDGGVYYAVSVNGTCRSAALQVTVTVVLGNVSFDLSQLNYHPNPVKNIFNVKYIKEIIYVEVYDLTGRKIMEMKPNTLEVQLNMTNLSNAMYIVRLQSVDGITELKVYKN